MSSPSRLLELLAEGSGERLPAALVDLEAFDRNARMLASIAAASGKTIRIATKSLRVPSLIRRALESHPAYRGLMCYSAEEALFLHELGFDDLLVAYPTLRPSDLQALRAIHDRGAKASLVVDSVEGLAALARAMKGAARPFPAVIEVDASLRILGLHLGVRRSPIATPAEMSALVARAASHPELRIAGLMSYEAQVAGLGDRNPFKPLLNPVAALVRRLSVRALRERRSELAFAFRQSGLVLELFNGGGSGSFNLSAREPELTELAAGSGLLGPHLFDYFSNIRFEPACWFALQAVRAPDPGRVTFQGGGYIASGAPGWDKVPVPAWPAGLELDSNEGCGEVQTPARVPASGKLELGSAALFRHAKAGELAERFNDYLLVSNGRIVERAKTYRGHGRCFF
jgi:D-serine deaminase-like pyridoxal phosphate-dependent protein